MNLRPFEYYNWLIIKLFDLVYMFKNFISSYFHGSLDFNVKTSFNYAYHLLQIKHWQVSFLFYDKGNLNRYLQCAMVCSMCDCRASIVGRDLGKSVSCIIYNFNSYWLNLFFSMYRFNLLSFLWILFSHLFTRRQQPNDYINK